MGTTTVNVDLRGLVELIGLGSNIIQRLGRIEARLNEIKEQNMALEQDLLDLNNRFDAATTSIGTSLTAIQARIEGLAGQVSAGLSPEAAARVKAALEQEASDIEAVAAAAVALGRDPENPIPEG